ncbi:MAG TPA: hypothetical protein VMA72_03020 [Streptosporangiaceae bacterium]|nr:hypothetical protein [Streptosporangiaceae bacterium]
MTAAASEPGLSPALIEAKPRPSTGVLRLYKPYYEDLLRYNFSSRDFIERRDAPEQCFRWLIELDCGCVTDAVTSGHQAAHVQMEELSPADCVFERFLESGKSGASKENLLLFSWGVSWKYSNWDNGYAWCAGHRDDLPVREITEWVERTQRPGHYSEYLGKELGPYASWVVKLSCGHYEYHAMSEVNWRPEQGYAEQADLVAKISRDLVSEDLDAKTKKALERMLVMRSTEPQSREECRYCVYMRRVVGCRPVGQLAKPKPHAKPEESPQPPSRRTLTRRLNAAEANITRLRDQLAQAEHAAARLREERDKASSAPDGTN